MIDTKFLKFNGDPITGKLPLQIKYPRGYDVGPKLDEIAQVYRHFRRTVVDLSIAPSHSKVVRAQDGTVYNLTSRFGQDVVMVAPGRRLVLAQEETLDIATQGKWRNIAFPTQTYYDLNHYSYADGGGYVYLSGEIDGYDKVTFGYAPEGTPPSVVGETYKINNTYYSSEITAFPELLYIPVNSTTVGINGGWSPYGDLQNGYRVYVVAGPVQLSDGIYYFIDVDRGWYYPNAVRADRRVSIDTKGEVNLTVEYKKDSVGSFSAYKERGSPGRFRYNFGISSNYQRAVKTSNPAVVEYWVAYDTALAEQWVADNTIVNSRPEPSFSQAVRTELEGFGGRFFRFTLPEATYPILQLGVPGLYDAYRFDGSGWVEEGAYTYNEFYEKTGEARIHPSGNQPPTFTQSGKYYASGVTAGNTEARLGYSGDNTTLKEKGPLYAYNVLKRTDVNSVWEQTNELWYLL
jgi:hypothetical protein